MLDCIDCGEKVKQPLSGRKRQRCMNCARKQKQQQDKQRQERKRALDRLANLDTKDLLKIEKSYFERNRQDEELRLDAELSSRELTASFATTGFDSRPVRNMNSPSSLLQLSKGELKHNKSELVEYKRSKLTGELSEDDVNEIVDRKLSIFLRVLAQKNKIKKVSSLGQDRVLRGFDLTSLRQGRL